jgi:hypothetical protein
MVPEDGEAPGAVWLPEPAGELVLLLFVPPQDASEIKIMAAIRPIINRIKMRAMESPPS